MSSSSTNELNRTLANMNSSLHSRVGEMDYQASWSIEDFPRLMREFDNGEAIKPKQFSIQLPGKDNNSLWTIRCFPKQVDDRGAETVVVALCLCSPDVTLKVAISIGLLTKDGAEEIWKEETQKLYCKKGGNPETVQASTTHAALRAAADRLLPDGRLHIYVKIRLLASTATMINSEIKIIGSSLSRQKQQQSILHASSTGQAVSRAPTLYYSATLYNKKYSSKKRGGDQNVVQIF